VPVSTSNNSSVFVEEPVANTPLTLDPTPAPGFAYFVLSGPLFSSVMVPQSSIPGVNSITLVQGGTKISLLPGQTYTFANPVNLFSLQGLTSSVPNTELVSKVAFASSGLAVFAQVALPPGGSLIGDLNGDGVVNCLDLDLVKDYFGKTSLHPGFDPRADANGDGVVNILDLSIVARQLPAGTVCQ
jgi:hypothetical protein